MSSGTQVDLDWAAAVSGDAADSGVAAGAAQAGAAGSGARYLSDEEILGMEPGGSAASTRDAVILSEAKNLSSIDRAGGDTAQRDSSGKDGPRFTEGVQREQNDNFREATARDVASPQMPSWMAAAAADPAHGAEAQELWRAHQEFCAVFSSPGEARVVADEVRAMKELLPGGVKDAISLREASASVERIDAALFSGDARAQGEVVAELARANPAAFRSMFAEAARVLAGMGGGSEEAKSEDLRSRDVNRELSVANHQSPVTGHQSPQFDSAAYAAFERGTNDAVGRDVRAAIGETLGRVMPEGVAEGAARRIGEDIFNDVHRALAADRALSEQVAAVLRDRRFGGAEQQRVAALLAGRAKQLVPSVARRVIGEWTTSVLSTARAKASRQAVAASRVDIAAPGGSADSMPLRAMSAREVNYASMSDEQILGM